MKLLVSLSQKELLTELKEIGDEFENIVLGTYSLQPQFFEDVVLNILQQKDAKNVLVMVDGRHYIETFKSAKEAGVTYLIEPIIMNYDFHSKFILLTSEDSGKLFVQSCNVTENGFMRNGDVFSLVDSDLSYDYPETIFVFQELKEFFSSLSSKQLISCTHHQKKILNSLDYPWLENAKLPEKSQLPIRLLHSVNKPILHQLQDQLSDEEIEQIVIVSPFFDLKGKVLRYLTTNFSKNIQLYIQPDRVQNLPIKTIKALERKGNNISVYKLSFNDDVNRYLHAKILIFKTKYGSYCLTGSANATVAGLLSNSATGNIELSLLRYENKKSYFDYLIKNNSLSSKKIKISSLKSNPSKPITFESKTDFYITEARLESDNLILHFSPSIEDVYKYSTITITRTAYIEPVIITKKLVSKDKIIIPIKDELEQLYKQSAYVTIQLQKTQDRKEILQSNKRWISTQFLELTPRKRDIRLIEKTNGRNGLIRLMDQLKTASEIPSMFLYYLQYIDFDWLADTLNKTRRRIVQRTHQEDGLQDEFVSYERKIITAQDVLEKIVKRHDKKFKKLVTGINNVEDYDARIRNIFNLFLFLNKIIIWFILRLNCYIEDFDDIIRRMELLVGTREKFWYNKEGFGFFDMVKEIIGKKEFHKSYNALNVQLHFIVLSKILQSLAKNSKLETSNGMKHRLNNLIYLSCVEKNKKKEIKKLFKTRFQYIIQEYEEYETFNLSEKEIVTQILSFHENTVSQGSCNNCGKRTSFQKKQDEFLCPKCARKVFKKSGKRYHLMRCVKCGYTKWLAHSKKGRLEFCEKDSMYMKDCEATLYIPKIV